MFDETLAAHLAELSKLEFTKEELARMTSEMDDIVRLMDAVRDFDANDRLSTATPTALEALRPDEVVPSMERGDALANAKEKTETFFRVPKVV